jgi:hypothetical protein
MSLVSYYLLIGGINLGMRHKEKHSGLLKIPIHERG